MDTISLPDYARLKGLKYVTALGQANAGKLGAVTRLSSSIGTTTRLFLNVAYLIALGLLEP